MNDPYDPKPVLQATRLMLEKLRSHSITKEYKIVVNEVKDFLRPTTSGQLRFRPPLTPSIEQKYEDEDLFDPLHNYQIDPTTIEANDGFVEMY
jgi:hypothetical protein